MVPYRIFSQETLALRSSNDRHLYYQLVFGPSFLAISLLIRRFWVFGMKEEEAGVEDMGNVELQRWSCWWERVRNGHKYRVCFRISPRRQMHALASVMFLSLAFISQESRATVGTWANSISKIPEASFWHLLSLMWGDVLTWSSKNRTNPEP